MEVYYTLRFGGPVEWIRHEVSSSGFHTQIIHLSDATQRALSIDAEIPAFHAEETQ